MGAALVVEDLEVVYQGVIQALSNLSLRVPEGSIVTLLGANGAGKTTTLKAISNFLPLENGRVTRGSITIGGENILKLAPHIIVRRGTFHVREGRHVFSEMTVEENLIAATYAQGRLVRAPMPLTRSTTTFPSCGSAGISPPAISRAANSRCLRSAVRWSRIPR